ncbi:hypothetical protein D3C80_1313650 [compost metagenome]
MFAHRHHARPGVGYRQQDSLCQTLTGHCWILQHIYYRYLRPGNLNVDQGGEQSQCNRGKTQHIFIVHCISCLRF